MEEGSSEILRMVAGVSVLTIPKVPANNSDKVGVVNKPLGQPVKDRSEERYHRSHQNAVWFQNAVGLGKRLHPVAALCQVVEGPQQQDSVRAGIGVLELAGISDRSAGEGIVLLGGGSSSRLLHMKRHRVNEVDLVTFLR